MVYRWTGHFISGHTLKHLSAAMVPVFLTLMLAKRSVEPDRYDGGGPPPPSFLVLQKSTLFPSTLCRTTLLDTWRVSWARVRERGFFKAESLDCEYAVVSAREG